LIRISLKRLGGRLYTAKKVLRNKGTLTSPVPVRKRRANEPVSNSDGLCSIQALGRLAGVRTTGTEGANSAKGAAV